MDGQRTRARLPRRAPGGAAAARDPPTLTPTPRRYAGLPVLGSLLAEAERTSRRFAFAIAAALVATISALLLIEDLGPDAFDDRLLAAATLGLPLLTALTFTLERGSPSRLWRLGWWTAGLGILASVYVAWPGWSETVRVTRYVQLSAAFHLLVAVLPFVGRDEPVAFWQFNRRLFERFLLGGFYAGVLYVGLVVALVALDQLFGVDVADEGYLRLWVVIAFLFTTWFFLAGVPADIAALETARDYPRGLEVFTRYVLVPLVSVYLLILTVYLGKVLVTWEWPSGWIGWLVSSVAVIGILALLLVHPVAEAGGWVGRFARMFWIVLLPAVGMLWLAIGQRIAQYGVTERRYFLVVLSLWLAGVAVYYIVTRSRRIRLIPASLCALAVMTFAGPWSAYSVSRASQRGRLERLLARNGLLVEGRFVAATEPVPLEDRRQISGALDYLAGTHGLASIARWLPDSLANTEDVSGSPVRGYRTTERVRRVMTALGMEYVPPHSGDVTERFIFSAADASALPVAGFDSLVRIEAWDHPRQRPGLWARLQSSGNQLDVFLGPERLATVPLDSTLARVRAWRARDSRTRPVPPDLLRVDHSAARADIVVFISSLGGAVASGVARVEHLSADVLVRLH